MRIGVDLGGTKIEIAAFDARGAALLRRRVPSPSADYDAIVERIGSLVEDVERELGRRGSVGVGTPGSASPATGRLRNANSTVLIGREFERDLSGRLARPVRIANDADCFALSEAADGAGAGAFCVFGVILGTGVGGGIVVGGRLVRGHNGIAGEWGHNPLPWPAAEELPGPRCYCGKHGCIETFLSGPSFARDHAAGGGTPGDPRTIVAAAGHGEPFALASVARYADRLARALATVINVLDPGVVVLGGGFSNATLPFEDLPQRLQRYVFSDVVRTTVARNVHGDSSGVRGAAWLWDEA